jgi:hypothetical protein
MTRTRGAFVLASSVALAGSIGLTACSDGQGAEDNCFGKCDGLGSGVHNALSERTDPIARYLMSAGIDDEGFIDADFGDVLFGLAEIQGCAQDSIKTFLVSDDLITGDEAFPRLVSVSCSSDAAKASEFYMAASFESFEEPGEMDLLSIEMFGWDANRREYTFYETFPAERGGVRVDHKPVRCQQCHLTPGDQAPVAMHMTPIMNELTRPWAHWNAEPGFPSFNFSIPERAQGTESMKRLVDPFKGQADQLETIIRAGHDKVALARLRERRDSVDMDKAMGLLRPVFCSEQINYASEDFNSGAIFNTAIVDPGIQQAYFQIRPDNWEWSWVNDTIMRLPAPTTEVVKQLPVRGNSDVAVENLLMSTRVLTPHQILRVRALDWKRPVFSEFRCGLWREAQSRFEADPPDLSSATRISSAIPILYDAIMVLGPHALAGSDAETLVALPFADAQPIADLFTALSAGDVGSDCTAGFCAIGVDDFGVEVQAHYAETLSSEAGRAFLFEERDRRICHLMEKVKVVDDRFDDDRVQRDCATDCCAEIGHEGDDICIGQAAAAARVFDTSRPEFECAVECATPPRFVARPSLPDVEGCTEPSRWLP